MQKTNIEWADYVWNPVTGCTKVSQGCKNCYAETWHHRFEKKRGKFTNVVCHDNRLDQPIKVKKAGIVFVNSMSDLFHEDVPFDFIMMCFNQMKEASHHTFLILTKRPQRAYEFFSDYLENWYNVAEKYKPLPNVWLGVSCEDQATANERIPLLLQIPAAVRFLSCEPLLGPIDLSQYPDNYINSKMMPGGIHWVICGGESGHKARPMHPDWARSLRDQCTAANVPFFFKQWGEWVDNQNYDWFNDSKKYKTVDLGSGYFTTTMNKVGKSKSGALLDGKEHREVPPINNSKLITQN